MTNTTPEEILEIEIALASALNRFTRTGPDLKEMVDAVKSTLSQAGLEISPEKSFQARILPWMHECFGFEISSDRVERNHRFFEECGELVQSLGMPRNDAHALVDYTWDRPLGEPSQEVGGVMVTLAALCLAQGLDMHRDGEIELTRIDEPDIILKIRKKQAAKPKRGPLPVHPEKEQPP